jgi:Tol biopolymer transport system component/serine/threonine protein kinase
MTPEQFRRAGELFEELRDCPPREQMAALDAACPDDPELRARVERLLLADRRADSGGFLENAAMDDAARLIQPELAPDLPAPGTVVGHYRLGARVGVGGMGVVYEAEDLRLKRRVAVKVLPLSPASANSQERIQRFEREARAASQLNHPHIVSIYDAAFDQGCYYIAMEFVEGRTLRRLIATESRLMDAKTVLDLVSQVALALVASHGAGIVHRDIKPENIMVRPDGFVKVLDFGLASMLEAPGGGSPDSELRKILRTRPGHLAGTIHYLSPEQVMGKPATPRSDLFSLGVVAYELATGLRPFDGPTDGAVFEAILNRVPPPPSAIRPAMGDELDAMVALALEKDPEMRIQTAQDLRSHCRRLSRSSSGAAIPATVEVGRRRTAWRSIATTAAVTIATVAALWYFLGLGHQSLPAPAHFERLTASPAEPTSPSLSPDGKQFVYAAVLDGKSHIYLQRTGGSSAVDLTAASGDNNIQPAISLDGNQIAFRSERQGGGLFVMEATGENPRRIAPRGYLPAWSPDGKSIAYSILSVTSPMERMPPPSGLYVVSVESGAERKLPAGDAVQPNWSPHGTRIAYWGISAGGRRDIFTVAASGNGEPVAVTSDQAVDWYPVWAPDGRQLYFLSDRGGTMNVWRVPIDEQSGRTLGAPQPVTVPAQQVGGMALSADGKSLIYSQTSQRSHLVRIGFDPQRRTVVGQPLPLAESNIIGNFTFSPDGSQIVYDTIGDTSENLWVANSDGSNRRRLTSDSFRNRSPQWSPRGDRILFYSDRSGHYDEWLINAAGSGLRALTAAPQDLRMQDGAWSPDGRRILVGRFEGGVELDPDAPKPDGKPKEIEALRSIPGVFPIEWQAGPNGGQVLSDLLVGPTAPEIAVYLPGEGRVERTGASGRRASWVRAEPAFRYFVFGRDTECYLYDRLGKAETLLLSIAPNRFFDLALAPDGRALYYTQRIRRAELWLARLR